MPKIPESEIESIKQSVDLVSLCRSRGIELKKVGKNFQSRCPFHDDEQASFTVTPGKNLWNCFGCGKGGDVIELVMCVDKVSFPEAVAKLQSKAAKIITNTAHSINSGQAAKKKTRKEKISTYSSRDNCLSGADRSRLLSLVADYYHAAFNQQKTGRSYMKQRGLMDPALFSRFKVGFCTGNIRESMPRDGKMLDDLKTLGVLTEDGREFFTGCVVFSISDLSGQIVNLYGRRIRDGQVNHLYLPGPKQGIFNGLSLKTAEQIILVESILDALAMIQAGYPGSIPCFGSAGIPDQIIDELKKYPRKAVYLCFDSDNAGNRAGEKAREQLNTIGIEARQISLPAGHDPCSILSGKDGKTIIRRLIHPPGRTLPMGASKEITPSQIIQNNGCLQISFADRTYEIKGLGNDATRCRVTVKVKQNGLFHLDTIDLYSARSRSGFARVLAETFGIRDAQITAELMAIIDPIEQQKAEAKKEPDPSGKPEMSDEDKKAAFSFLTASKIFRIILEDFETVGVTGEETNKLIGYLAAVSRKLPEPLSVCIQSRSAAGKSVLQNAILDFVPPEELVRYTRLTGQALFYKNQDSLKHKILAIEEELGAREANYSIRTIQSSKYLSIASAGRDPETGKMKTDEHRVEGPVVIFITTTEPELDGETASRFIFLTIDESREATEKIHAAQRTMETLEGLVMQNKTDHIIEKHRNAQRLLRDGLQVVNPYSPYLTFHSDNIRTRRDHKKYLTLIKVIAYLRQYQREIRTVEVDGRPVQYVEVSIDDIRDANRLAAEVLGSSLDELSPPSRRLLGLIREMVLSKSEESGLEPRDFSFSRRKIREFTGWSDFQVKTHIGQLVDLEYLYSVVGRKGKEYIYELRFDGNMDSNEKFLAGLADVNKLAETPGNTVNGVTLGG